KCFAKHDAFLSDSVCDVGHMASLRAQTENRNDTESGGAAGGAESPTEASVTIGCVRPQQAQGAGNCSTWPRLRRPGNAIPISCRSYAWADTSFPGRSEPWHTENG